MTEKKINVEALVDEYPELASYPSVDCNLVEKISETMGIPFAILDIAIKRYFTEHDGEVEVDTVVGGEASKLVEATSEQFIEETCPELLDDESVAEALASPFPRVRRDAINRVVNAQGLSFQYTVATATSPDTSPLALEKIIHKCVDELIENRVRGDYSSELPGYFYAAVRNPNTPREALALACRRLIDPRWQVNMLQLFVSTTVSKLTAASLEAWMEAHGDATRECTKEIVDPLAKKKATIKAKPIRRMNDLEGDPPEDCSDNPEDAQE